MSDDDEIIKKDTDAKTWSCKFPGSLANKMINQVKEYGYLGMSDYIRGACRDKTMYLQARAHKEILDYLVSTRKLSVGDVKEAIYAVTSDKI